MPPLSFDPVSHGESVPLEKTEFDVQAERPARRPIERNLRRAGLSRHDFVTSGCAMIPLWRRAGLDRPRDVVVIARRFPDVSSIAYPSGYDPDAVEGPFEEFEFLSLHGGRP